MIKYLVQRPTGLTITCLSWRTHEVLVYKIVLILQTTSTVASFLLRVQRLGFQIPELKLEPPCDFLDVSCHCKLDAADSLLGVPAPAGFLARFPAERSSSGSADVSKVTSFIF